MRNLSFLVLGSLILATPSIASAAGELPKRRAGLWEMTMQGPAGAQVVKQCIDADTDRLMMNLAGPYSCTQTSFEKVGDTYEIATVCKIGPMTAKGMSKISGDFEKKVKVEAVTEVSGAPGSVKPVTSTIAHEISYVGPCAAGQSPGDMIMPDGKIIKLPQAAR